VGWNLPSLELTLSDDVLATLAAMTEPIREKLGNDPDLWMMPSRYR